MRHDKQTKSMKSLFLFIITSFHILTFGQKSQKDIYDIGIPNKLEKCFPILMETLTENEINIIKTFPEDSIYFSKEFKNGTDFFHAWKIYDGSRLTKYFNKKGLYDSHEIYETILISYHRFLNNKPINLEQQIEKYKLKNRHENEEYLKRTKQDSINGIYIPKDIKDCFVTLDSLLSKENIKSIKELPNKNETIEYHHGLGLWLRNNWGLWGGSRLQKYFLARKVNHPDSMSAMILEYYHDWLNNRNIEWEKFNKK